MAESAGVVTVCVPVYNGAAFVEETLSSICQQSHTGFTALISVDSSADESAAICRSFLHDNRFQLFEQERHLGWISNCNWLVSRVRTPYFLILPHDDILHPYYIDRLFAAAEAHPSAAVVYSDIRLFGSIGNQILVQPSIQGRPITRILTFLMEHHNAVAFRGLVRSEVSRKAGLLQNNPFDGFAADTVWLMKLAKQGDFIRVAEPLYSKRYHNGSVHLEWSTWNRDRKILAWTHHCLELAVEAFRGDGLRMQQTLLLQALVFRLLRSNPNLGPYEEISKLSNEERQSLISAFLSRLAKLVGENRLDSLIRQSTLPYRDTIRSIAPTS